ncbi:hypothetical protein [Citrobacter sp. wls714]|uniref:hypothetical protein n=1 Tax=Citrobacter sp. wls714 TaxID=2576422 RepID=UPI0010C9A261|nr:hypothetical protein [Citrobacter sp. wls714]TKU48101.1 hypothetical protein FDX11_10365 [Citrobacter sp. wls714]
MNVIELKGIIAQRFGVDMITTAAEDFKAYGVRFKYHGNMYRATTDLTIERVDGGCLVTDDDTRHMENILRGEEWDGEGRPPVGCECEFNAHERGWEKRSVLYASKYTVLLRTARDGDPEEAFTPEDLKFRPIRSEAEKKRDEAVAKLTDAICGEVPDTGMATAANYAVRAYDAIAAGKIPHVHIE